MLLCCCAAVLLCYCAMLLATTLLLYCSTALQLYCSTAKLLYCYAAKLLNWYDCGCGYGYDDHHCAGATIKSVIADCSECCDCKLLRAQCKLCPDFSPVHPMVNPTIHVVMTIYGFGIFGRCCYSPALVWTHAVLQRCGDGLAKAAGRLHRPLPEVPWTAISH